jgi:hypothetical protein
MSPAFYARNRPPQKVVMTARLGCQFFNVKGWPSLVGIFGSRLNAENLRFALTSIYNQDKEKDDKTRLLDRIIFKLRENESCLKKRFPNMKQLAVDQINDAYVRKAVLKGDQLENSELYEQWVSNSESGGRVLYFGVNIRDETIILGTLGNMYSRQGGSRFPVHNVRSVIQGLLDCNAMIYQSDLMSFSSPE